MRPDASGNRADQRVPIHSGKWNPIIAHGPLAIDLAACSVQRDGRPVPLTSREWAPSKRCVPAGPRRLEPAAAADVNARNANDRSGRCGEALRRAANGRFPPPLASTMMVSQ